MAKGNPAEGDTAKVDRQIVLVAFKQKVSKYDIDPTTKKRTKGVPIEVDGNAFLKYPEKLISYFNIPIYTPTGAETSASTKVIQRAAYTRLFYTSVDGTTSRTINVRAHDVIVAQRTGKAAVLSVTVPTGKLTAKANKRSVAFAFPGHFTIAMVAQALGTMLNNAPADKKPVYFKTKAGAQYLIPYGTSTDKIAGRDSGAWLATTPIAVANQDNPDNIPSGTQEILGTGGDRDAATGGI